jgi:MFS family permease
MRAFMSRPFGPLGVQRTDRWLYGWGLGYVAIGAASLLVPLFAISLGASAFTVGAIAATAAFAGVPGALLWGTLAARAHRRRPFVLIALAATALTLALFPLTTTPREVLLVNVILWFAVAAAAPVLNLIVVEGRPETEWNDRIGRLNAVQGYGWVAGLVVGAVWTTLVPRLVAGLDAFESTRLLFGFLAVIAALATVLARLWYPDPATVSTSRFRRVYRRLSEQGWGAGRYLRTLPYGTSRPYWALTSLRGVDPRALARRYGAGLSRYLLAALLFSTGFAVFWGPMPAYLRGVGYGSDGVFALFLIANVGSAASYAAVSGVASRVGVRRLQMGALSARIVLFPGVALLGGAALLAVLALGASFLAIGITWAVIAVTATALVTSLASPRVRGEALGLYTAIVGLGTGIGSALGGAVASWNGYLLAFALASALVLCGGVLVRDAA